MLYLIVWTLVATHRSLLKERNIRTSSVSGSMLFRKSEYTSLTCDKKRSYSLDIGGTYARAMYTAARYLLVFLKADGRKGGINFRALKTSECRLLTRAQSRTQNALPDPKREPRIGDRRCVARQPHFHARVLVGDEVHRPSAGSASRTLPGSWAAAVLGGSLWRRDFPAVRQRPGTTGWSSRAGRPPACLCRSVWVLPCARTSAVCCRVRVVAAFGKTQPQHTVELSHDILRTQKVVIAAPQCPKPSMSYAPGAGRRRLL
jgi:hypothetical protein